MDSLTAKNKRPDERAALTRAVVKVGNGGRGFVVKTKQGERLVITAAHCVSAGRRRLPLAHPEEEHTYQRLLGPLGKAKPTVSAASLFADPVADIAVLGSPDRQELLDEAEAYEALTGSVTPFAVADAPKQSIRFVDVPNTKLVTKERTPGQGAALVLSLAGEWLECTVTWRDEWLEIDQEKEIVKCGMSGSPIISPAGQAIGLMSTGSRNPVLVEALPPRIGLGRARGARGHR
jgi:hypothetical protein